MVKYLLGGLLVLAFTLVLSGCGDYNTSGYVVAKTPPDKITLAYCHHRAKMSDYVVNVTYQVSAKDYEETEIGEYAVTRDSDKEVGWERMNRC